MLDVLAEAIDSAGAAISDLIASDPSLDGMGSTVCGVMFDGDRLGLANIGDSRAYRWADGATSPGSPGTTPGCRHSWTRDGSPRPKHSSIRTAR